MLRFTMNRKKESVIITSESKINLPGKLTIIKVRIKCIGERLYMHDFSYNVNLRIRDASIKIISEIYKPKRDIGLYTFSLIFTGITDGIDLMKVVSAIFRTCFVDFYHSMGE